MEEPVTKFQFELDLVDILWRQDVDLGVEREVFDGCLRQRTEEARRAREREQKRERDRERIMQRLQKLDQETGEFLPSLSSVSSQVMSCSVKSPSTVSTQQSPITQNPLLTALLFSKSQKADSEEQAFSELPSVADLQCYLDLLESESPNSPLEDIIDMCRNIPSHEENSEDELCDLSELTKAISESSDVAQLLSTPCNSLLETCVPALSDSTDSPLNTVLSSSPPENLNQMSLTQCQSIFSEFCPEPSVSSSAQIHPEESSGPAGWETSRPLPCVTDSPVLMGFDDSASSGFVDLDTSLYASDQSEEELVCIQSNYIDLLPVSLDEHVTCAQDKPQTQPLPNLKTRRGARRVCRDEQRARALGLPLSVRDIITLPVEPFNEAVNSGKLSNAQLTLIRDIRRRGKNKMAAQSCRKRKLDSLVDLEEEVETLKRQKDEGEEERERNTTDLRDTKEKLRKLYNEVFSQLRNEHGNPYDPKRYKLQLSTDGTVYLLPSSIKNNTSQENAPVAV
ncbi:nuclear factor erythroid 2-related factor 2b [Triplophysa rosa]|uniref:Nuclear factor n=1 Tax=Triplophysa rosa TaxID=992332 RepID=A0A9W8C4Z8_TRIRA|nr:nuclear factor erythroid 2-related factor 2b [Triplophysa rosa]KAI7807595.1 nuclear factor [Triplophysa rosa]